ncbi:polymorphic toxin type 15 domain-containing protein [Photobacterium sanguinicancri]|uniref:Polymorphic toxin type 15 domain-containing protein n=1 Tax=Photobacterium sanguinicancri TaxID=875932 RepID=A0AAW7XYW3_9GAMM|nr:polymorphic toxin type 15 domain-containing protein [Photobacterium sanguinicancri]MDO6541508.1 polymorphic toxin type 15 domain-containing protein [Photobacterium sanguinicancri]
MAKCRAQWGDQSIKPVTLLPVEWMVEEVDDLTRILTEMYKTGPTLAGSAAIAVSLVPGKMADKALTPAIKKLDGVGNIAVHAAKKAKALKVMKKYTPPCFKPGKALKKSFKNNPKKLEKEFYKQLKDQQDGINNMAVGQYLENRETLTGLVKEHGHKKARQILTNGGAAQADARTKLVNKITKSASKSYRNQGMSTRVAEKLAAEKAEKTLKELAALHDPDMIAGGDDKIRRLGNKNVNSSLGSQWAEESRVSNIDKAAKQAMANSGADTRMNIELTRCKQRKV